MFEWIKNKLAEFVFQGVDERNDDFDFILKYVDYKTLSVSEVR